MKSLEEKYQAVCKQLDLWIESAFKYYPMDWAIDSGNPPLVMNNIVENLKIKHEDQIQEMKKSLFQSFEAIPCTYTNCGIFNFPDGTKIQCSNCILKETIRSKWTNL